MRSMSTGLAGVALLLGLLASPAIADGTGGVSYTPPSSAGGSQYGSALKNAPPPRPVARVFSVSPRTVTAPQLPAVTFRVDQAGTRSVSARVVFWPEGSGTVARADLGRVPTGRVVAVTWPKGLTVAPGKYLVRLTVKGRGGQTLARRAGATGKSNLVVQAPKPAPAPAPALTPAPVPVVPATAVPPGGVFPVQGPHTYGDPFGAQRNGYTHQGQDVLAAEGTPNVAPLTGIVTFTGYQDGGAGYYVVMHAVAGLDFFFAHCQKGSTVVAPGQAVNAGQQLCSVGHTGDATGPHLHFEVWVNGWRASKSSAPVDPLPYLQAWDH